MTTAPTDRELRRLKFDLDRDEREQKREAQREHGERWKLWDESVRDLRARCGFCGLTAIEGAATRQRAQDFAGAGALGHISIGLCNSCRQLYRRYVGGALNVEQLILWDSLKLAGLAEYHPDRGTPNHSRARVGLSWAGWAFRARQGGLEDPGDVHVSYSHIEGIKPEAIDFAPEQSQPVLARRL